jgi:hypothetical protein
MATSSCGTIGYGDAERRLLRSDAGVTLLDTGDKAVAGALIFVAVVANGIEAIVYFIGP